MNILIIAPHPDDEILGCGGTIAKYATHGDDIYVTVVTKGTNDLFSKDLIEEGRRECRTADAFLGVKETIFMDFPAAKLENVPRYKLNDGFLKIMREIKPDIVYLPFRGDMQLDHKLTVDAAMVALRPKYNHIVRKILMYETLSETGWDVPNTMNDFIPNVYEDVSLYMDKKLKALSIYKSQISEFPNARSIKAVEALATFRGTMMNLRAAEAFSLAREIRTNDK